MQSEVREEMNETKWKIGLVLISITVWLNERIFPLSFASFWLRQKLQRTSKLRNEKRREKSEIESGVNAINEN